MEMDSIVSGMWPLAMDGTLIEGYGHIESVGLLLIVALTIE